MAAPTPPLQRRSSIIDYLASLPRRPGLAQSIRARTSAASLTPDPPSASSSPSSHSLLHHPHHSTPTILRDPAATTTLLECVLASPGGRRALARLARTCTAFRDPALDVLWRDLDSFLPLVALFPTALMKRARRPALGLIRDPEPDDWPRVLAYGARVRSIAYVEAHNRLSPSVFPIFATRCPELLPHLASLTWKADTLAGLAHARPYVSAPLQHLTLELGMRAPQAVVAAFLDDVTAAAPRLVSFAFTLHSALPDAFVDAVRRQTSLERLALVAPGALDQRIGRWAAALPGLRSLQLDLTHAATRAVDGFFNDIDEDIDIDDDDDDGGGSSASGCSTPSSVSGTDSGVFSADEAALDFSAFRKSALRLTSDDVASLPRRRRRRPTFPRLTHVRLTGDAGTLARFLEHVSSPLVHLDLALHDPPVPADWKDLSALLADQFGQTLQTLRVTASSQSRLAELVRSTSRGSSTSPTSPTTATSSSDVELRHLPLEHLGPMPHLRRLAIELPESAVFHNADIAHLARVCPSLETLRLCGQARFPASGPAPPLTLEGLVPLTRRCARLHTLAVVLHAADAGRDETFRALEVSARALVRLNVGHSWVRDPLETAVLLSHLAPRLESLRWFPAARAGGGGGGDAGRWQQVAAWLGPMQRMRRLERSLLPTPVVLPPPPKADKQVDATVRTASRGVLAKPACAEAATQVVVPATVDAGVECRPGGVSVAVDATPVCAERGVEAGPSVCEVGVDAAPRTAEQGTDPVEPEPAPAPPFLRPMLSAFVPSVHGLVTMPMRAVRAYTYYLSFPFRYMFSLAPSALSAAPPHATIEDAARPEPEAKSPHEDPEQVPECSEKRVPHMHDMSTSTSPSPSPSTSTDTGPDDEHTPRTDAAPVGL